jgi:hypothetical protein
MKQNYSPRRSIVKKLLLITITISLIGTGLQTLSNKNIPLSIVSAQQDTWSLTLQITETTGSGDTVILGGSPNASDGQDTLDLPKPPAPPQQPYTRVWFTTPFAVPFNNLMYEYKHTPSPRMEWNLSILWTPEPGNISTTTISISWDPTQAAQSTYTSFQLYENNTAVANLLTEHSFSYPSNDTRHQFQIIGQGRSTNGTSQNNSTNGTSTQNNLPVLPILLGISILIIVLLIASFIYYKRKQQQRNEHKEKVRQRIQQHHLEEIKKLLEEHKNLSDINEKIQGWKNEGYNVEELEKVVEEQEKKEEKKETGKKSRS